MQWCSSAGVRGVPALIAIAVVAGGCASEGPAAPDAAGPVPTRALVVWVDSMCEITDSLTQSQERFEDVATTAGGNPNFADFEVESYLRFAASDVESLARRFDALAPSGVPGGDELVGRYRTELRRIQPEVAAAAPEDPFDLSDLPPATKLERARALDELLGSIRPGDPDLRGLVAADPTLAAAYELAPRCTPLIPQPLPPAADGSEVGACADGRCQIAVSAPVDVAVASLQLTMRVERGRLFVESKSAGGGSARSVTSTDSPGTLSIGNGQDTATITIVGGDRDNAVVDISTS